VGREDQTRTDRTHLPGVIDDQADLLAKVGGALIRSQFDIDIRRLYFTQTGVFQHTDSCRLVTVIVTTFPRRPAGDNARQR